MAKNIPSSTQPSALAGKTEPRWIPTSATAVKITLWYASVGALWILCSGWVLHHFVQDAFLAEVLEDIKGWLYVGVTALLLCLVLDRYFRVIRRSARQLQENEARLHLLSDNLPDSYVYQFTRDADGTPRFTYISAGVERVHGVTADEVLRDANHIFKQFDPEQTAAYVVAEKKSAITLANFEMEFQALRPDGTVRQIRARSRPTQTDGGQLVWDGFTVDITERNRVEQSLHETSERYRTLFENMLNGFAYCRMIFADGQPQDFVYLAVNPAFETLTGLKEVTGKKVSEVIPGLREADPKLFELYARVARTGEPARFETYVEALQNWFEIALYSPAQDHFVAVFDVVTKRKQAEAELRASQKLLSEMGRSAKIGGWDLDPVTGQGHWTEEVARIHDLEPGDLPSKERGINFYHGESRARIAAAVKEAIEHGTPYDLELEIVSAKGTHKWVRTICQPVVENGKVVKLHGSLQDITERALVEQAFRETQALHLSLVQQLPIGIFQKDPAGRYVLVNPGFCQLKGMKAEAFLGRTPVEVAMAHLPHADPAGLAVKYAAKGEEHHRRIIQTGEPIELDEEYILPDGTKHFVTVMKFPVFSADGRVTGTQGLILDITKRKQMEDALRRSEQNYREIFNAANDAIFLHDAANGRVLDVNPAMLHMYGYAAKEEVLSVDTRMIMLNDPLYTPEEAQRRLRLCLEEGPQVFEWQAVKKTGESFWVEVSLRSARIDGQTRILAVVRDISGRKRVEDALRESQALFFTSFHSSPISTSITDLATGEWVEVNEAFLEVTGYTRAEIIGQTFRELNLWKNPGDRDKVMAILNERGCVINFEVEITKKGGTTGIMLIAVEKIEQAGRPHLLIMGVEITDRKRAEQSLRQSEEQFRAMFELASVGMAQADPATVRFTRVNQKLCALTGFTEAELLTRSVADITHPDDREADAAAFQRVVRGEANDYRMEKRYVRKDQTLVWVNVNVTLIRDHDGRPLRSMATIEDITARKRTEEALKLQGAALKAAANAIVITDSQGNIEWTNPAFTQFTGYTAAVAVGQNPRLLKSFDHAQPFYRDLWDTILTGKTWHGELSNRRKDGTLYQEEMTITPVRNARGDIAHFIAIKQDITARKRIEKEYRQAQKMEAVGKLAGGVAHDFNNNLQVVFGYTSMLLSGLPEGTDQHREVLEIQRAAERSASLTRQLLAFSRRQLITLTVLDLNAVIGSTAKMLKVLIGEDIALTTRLAPDLKLIQADTGNMEQIVMNLAVNARDAMPGGGKLTISTDNVVLDIAAAAALPQARPGEFACLTVTDTGCGMSPDLLQHIFEPFFSTKGDRGTGLGLSVIYDIVQQHHGWVNVTSEVDLGTLFKVYLPVYHEEPAANAAPDSPAGRGHGENILLLEDDAALCKLTERLLRANGYLVQSATTAAAARDTYDREQGRFDLFFTDVILPDGNGFNIAEEFSARQPGLTVLISSGYTEERSRWGDTQAGNTHYIQKPYGSGNLLVLIRRILDERAAKNQPPPAAAK